MRLFQKEHVFHNDWGTITSAFWVKYPNELQPHVLRVDTLDLQIDVEQQQFVCRRLLSLKYQCPKWVQKFFGASPIGFAVEEATCSLKDRKLTLKSCNYTFASFFRVEEACEYTPHPDNPQHTLYKQTATYKVSGLGLPVNRAVENAAVAQAAEKSLLGVSVVERLGTFLAEQQWRECCNSCLLSLEEAAANASKHAQEKYRQLRLRVGKKLGVASPPAEFGSELSGQPSGRDATSSAGSDIGMEHVSVVPGEPEATWSDRGDTSTSQAVSQVTPPIWDVALPENRSNSTHMQNDEEWQQNRRAEEPLVGLVRHSASPEGSVDTDCPCRLSTPSGRRPAPTFMWRDFRKQWREAAFPDLRAPATSAASSGAASFRPGAIDFPLVVRDGAAAARCQQYQPHVRQQATDWRARQQSPLENSGTRPGTWYQQQGLPSRGYGVLFSTLGGPSKG